MESLRAFGYDLATALADLVDNSIAKQASEVRVEFCSDEGAAWVAVVDNGVGMTESELHEAVRFGGDGPSVHRGAHDLGRFGLGLKTASLSQCRALTVLSRTDGGLACRTWDLDHVRATDDWRVFVRPDGEALHIAETVGFRGRGTMVLWRRLDNVGEGRVLAQRLGQTRVRLAMWFHRFIEDDRLRLLVSGRPVTAWDPFWRHHMATQDLGTERLERYGGVTVTPYVLPHPGRLSEAELAAGAGPRGWNAQQGFYVYRGDRLVSAGGWLGLGDMTITPQTRLARIEVHVDPANDHRWQVDVRKSRVHVPSDLEAALVRLAGAAREASVRVFRRRASTAGQRRSHDITYGWVQERRHGVTSYTVNRRHPVVEAALRTPNRSNTEALLRLVERTLPVGFIAIEAESNLSRTPQAAFEGVDEAEVRKDLLAMLSALPEEPESRERAVRALAGVEPFNRFPELLAEVAGTGQASPDGARK
ncbi:ATP-binding protein [Streptomyces fenghuangensis]